MGFLDRYINKAVATSLSNLQMGTLRADNRDLLNLINGYNLPTLNGDTYNYYQAWKTVGAVYECTDLIAKKILNADIVVYRIKNAKKLKESEKLFKSGNFTQAKILKAQSIEEVTDHVGINELLAKPNDYMNGTHFIWSTALMYMLRGNCFVYGNTVGGKPKQLIPFAQMEIIADRNDILNPVRGYKYIIDGYDFECLPHDMYHMKTANPRMVDLEYQHLYGVSPLCAYLEPMRTIDEANKQASKQMKNGGKMQLLSPEREQDAWSSEQRIAFGEALRDAKRSNNDLSRLIPSELPIRVSDIGLSSAELQLIDQKKASSQDIYRAYHVPLQYLSSDSSTYNNQSTAVKQLIYDAVSPVAKALSEMLTNFVGKPYGDYIIEIDLTTLPEMASDMGEVSKWMLPAYEAGVFNVDEVRLALNYDELGTPESQAYQYRKPNTNTNNGQINNQDAG